MILTSGAFDGVHAGHVAYLEAAKALCELDEVLVCAVAPDDYIAAAKGRAPYWTQRDRRRTVAALDVVDATLAQTALSVSVEIRRYRPRLFVKGPDWKDRLPEDVLHACDDTGTTIAYVDTEGRHGREARPTDEEALAQFEALVRTQQPASAPWAPVTDYSFEARKAIEGRQPALIKAVFEPTRVLDVGCGPGHLVRLLGELGVSVWGEDLPGFDVSDPDAVGSNRQYDLVICREVLEHLTIRQIHRAVTNLCTLSSKYVYLTTRFAQQPAHFLSVDTHDGLDPTHISMMNQAFLRTLFVLEGFKRRADLEARMDWLVKGRVLVYERCTSR